MSLRLWGVSEVQASEPFSQSIVCTTDYTGDLPPSKALGTINYKNLLV